MGRTTPALASMLTALWAATVGCGDPMIVIGDAPGVVRIVAGIPEVAGDSLGAVATQSPLNSPNGLAAGTDGTIYIADGGNSRILAVASSGAVDVLADHSFRHEEPRLLRPDGLALDPAGALYIADPDGQRIWRLELANGAISVIAGTGNRGSSPDTSDALLADLDRPSGVAIGPEGRVYFSESGGHRVRAILPSGALVTIAGSGVAGSDGDGGSALLAQLRRPSGLALVDGVLYIADSGNHRVRAVDLASGVINGVAGLGLAGFAGDGGPAGQALFNNPIALAITADATSLFIADADNHRIRVVNLGTLTVLTFAGTGDVDFNGDLLSAGQTALNLPSGLVVSSFNFVYLSDAGHHIVRRSAVRFVQAR